MSRYAKANQTIDDLKELIKKSTHPDYLDGDDGEGCPYGIICEDTKASATIVKDLSKVNVDFENTDYIGEYEMPGTESLDRFEMIGNGAAAFPVAWCACGGDWENPLVFVLYIGHEGKLRGYIPKDGNVYNKKEKAAYGNNDDDPSWEDNPDDPLLQFDVTKLRNDVAHRIVVELP